MRCTPQTLAHGLQQVTPIKLDLIPHRKGRPKTTPWWLLRNPRSKSPHHDRAGEVPFLLGIFLADTTNVPGLEHAREDSGDA